MSDEEIVKALAERVFDPLTSDAEACAVLDKMAEIYDWDIECIFGEWNAFVFTNHPEHELVASVIATTRRRAICLAALKAIGAETE